MDLVSEKGQIREDGFLVRWGSRGGGGVKQKGYMKALRFDMVLIYYLDETGALNIKLDQVSG